MNFSDAFIAWIHVKVITFARTNAGIIFTVVKTLEEKYKSSRCFQFSFYPYRALWCARKQKRMSLVVRNEDNTVHWIARLRAGLPVRIREKFWRRGPGSTLKISPPSHK